MSWKLFGRAFSISFGIPSDPEDLPMDKLLRHVLYMIIANDAASGRSVEEVISLV